MPGFTTHYLFGQTTYQKLPPSSLKLNIQNQHAAFALGLQGPDIFFYYVSSYFSQSANPGSLVHTKNTGRFFRALIESRLTFPHAKEKAIASAYILGFFGHYSLDMFCHPYVYARTNYASRSKDYYGHHICLETDIDTTLLYFYQKKRPSTFRQEATIALTKEQLHVIAHMLYYSYSAAYPEIKVSHNMMIRAIHSMQHELKLLYDPSGRKKAHIRRIESIFPGYPLLSCLIPSDSLIFHSDPLNTQHRGWRNPWDTSRYSHESFFDLIDSAREYYLEIIKLCGRLFLARPYTVEEKKLMVSLLSKLGNQSFHSGLDCSVDS